MHVVRARTPVWFEYINGLLASVWYILVITRPLSQFRQFIGAGKSVLTKIKNVTNARTPGFCWHKYFHISLSLDHKKNLAALFQLSRRCRQWWKLLGRREAHLCVNFVMPLWQQHLAAKMPLKSIWRRHITYWPTWMLSWLYTLWQRRRNNSMALPNHLNLHQNLKNVKN